MNLKEIKAPLWDGTLNNINYNFNFLSESHRRIQTQINDLVLDAGESNQEVAQARGGHQVLADRLNSVDSQLAQTEQEVDNLQANKINKGEVTRSELDKSSDDNLWDINDANERTRAMIQGLESGQVNAVLGEGNVTESNIANGAVTSAKRTVLGGQAYIIAPNSLPNISINSNGRYLVIDRGTIFHHARARVTLLSTTSIELTAANNTHYIFLDMVSREFVVYNSSVAISELTQQLVYVATIIFERELLIKSVDIACDYTINGELKSRTRHQGMATLTFGNPFKVPNINMANQRMEIFGQTTINWDDQRYLLNTSKDGIYEIDFSTVWGNGDISPRIYFDTVEKDFKVIRSNDPVSVLEHYILFAELRKGNNQTLLDVNIASRFTVDGKEFPNKLVDKPFIKLPSIPDGWYKSPEVDGYETASQYDDNITFEDIYNVYDRLVSENDDYTRTERGLDATGTYPLYAYEQKPQSPTLTQYNKEIPTIIIFSGVHGEEKASVLALRNAMQHIADNWKTNPYLRFLRHNIHFVIVPIANPYGFQAGTRKNGRGVDINRNWSHTWEGFLPGADPEASTYKGPEPFSESETRMLRDLVSEYPNALAVIDYHHLGGGGNEYYNTFWHNLNQVDLGFDEFHQLSSQNIRDITVEAQLDYGVPDDSGLIGYVSYQHVIGPTISNHISNVMDIPSMTVECAKKLPFEENVYTSNLLQLNTEFTINFILNLIRVFNN